MPLLPGSNALIVSKNIEELHQGPKYKRNKRKFGKKKADKIAVAIALTKAGKSKR